MATPTEADLRAIFAMRPEAAIEYLERKGFAITWNWHDVDAATHARALTVAKAARLDVLQDIRDALVDNLERGGTLRDFQRNLRPILEAKGWVGGDSGCAGRRGRGRPARQPAPAGNDLPDQHAVGLHGRALCRRI
ncbi:hypothetical protein P4G46_09005 [Pseudomonas aeruginosa]|uniref:phage head morphogenesis protein n=1 Tax=Pseudomonas aeruginosa TaxID=287 RepID=UPI00283AA4B9|nr:hypothetical protein [Pseudomonas aeruginosa]WMU87093.1 hypothetical protein P4G46_09005 [Pseudomonas aeruginosa]